jgi:hypothetical protein
MVYGMLRFGHNLEYGILGDWASVGGIIQASRMP